MIFGRPFFITSMLLLSFIFWLSCFDILDLCVTFVCVRFLVYLHSSKGIQSLSHFQVTYNQLQSFVIQTSSTIYISLAESCLFFFFFGDLHPFKESCHLGFVGDLHLSWNLIAQPFFGDLHPFKESCHLGFVSDLHPSWQNLII